MVANVTTATKKHNSMYTGIMESITEKIQYFGSLAFIMDKTDLFTRCIRKLLKPGNARL